MEKYEGGPRKWEARAVRHENGQRLLLLPVFSHFFFLNPPLTPVTLTLPAPPPPSRPNASRMWFFFFQFRCFYHDHDLPHIQSRAGSGSFVCFDVPTTTTTSLASKREPEVDLFDIFDTFTTATTSLTSKREPEVDLFDIFDAFTAATTSLTSKREPEVDIFDVSTRLLPPPPPSRPNASWRWIFSTFLTRLPPPPPPSHPNVSQRWIFSTFRHVYRHHHLPCVQTRAGGGFFRRF